MRKVIVLFVFFVFSFEFSVAQTTNTHPEELQWYTNILEAHAISESSNKPIFAFFTGSDWCGWCKKLQKEVFAKSEFINWANKNVVLVELDFPRSKQLPPEVVKQNTELQQVFNVRGYPTIWMFYLKKDDTANRLSISALGSLGYPSGAVSGKEEIKFLEGANAILAKKTK